MRFWERVLAAANRWENIKKLLALPTTGRYSPPRNGRLAQLVERFVYTEDVGGSSPSSPTTLRRKWLRVARHSPSP